MRDILRIARFDTLALLNSPSVFVTHLLGLACVISLGSVQIAENNLDAQLILALVLLFTAMGAPLSVGAHTLVRERFRGTLESLLLLPISRATLLAGKAGVVIGLTLVELGAAAAFFAAHLLFAPDLVAWNALTSPPILALLFVGAPLLALLLTLVVITISGRARDAQAASNMAFLLGAPVSAVVVGLWMAALAIAPRLVVLAIAATLLMCGIAARTAAAWLTDDRLLSRRG